MKRETWTIKECQNLVKLWDTGQEKKFISIFGHEPTKEFLKSFRLEDTIGDKISNSMLPSSDTLNKTKA